MNTTPRITRTTNTALLALALVLGPVIGVQAERPAKDQASTAETALASSPTSTLNLNTATQEELIRLPGIGPTRAQAIVQLRTKLNGFKKLEDLMRVKGIGRKTFRKLQPLLRLDGKTTSTAGAAGPAH